MLLSETEEKLTGFYGRDHPAAGDRHSHVINSNDDDNDLIELDMDIDTSADVDIDCGMREENAVSN